MSESTSPADDGLADQTPRLAAQELPARVEHTAESHSTARKRDRESALGSGAATPNSSDDVKGFSLTPVAKKGRVQDATASPRQLREASTIIDAAEMPSRADVQEELANASPSPPETPPGQAADAAVSGELAARRAPETERVSSIRHKVSRMSTGDGAGEQEDEDDVESVSSSRIEPDEEATGGTEVASATSVTGEAGSIAGSAGADDDMKSVRAASPPPSVTAESLSTPVVTAAPSLPTVAPADTPAKPVSSFASFSKSASPFGSVPGSSKSAFGGPSTLGGSSAGKVLPLSKPNLSALVAATSNDPSPPSPASSVRAETGSIAPTISRQSSYAESPRVDRAAPEASAPIALPVKADQASTARDATPTPAGSGTVPPPPTPATGSEALPIASAAPPPPSASSFAARFAGSASAFGKAKSAAPTSSSAFGSFSSSSSSGFNSVRKAPYPAGGRRPSNDGSPSRQEKGFDELLKESAAGKDAEGRADDEAAQSLYKEQEVITGEEDEETLYSVRGKLYEMETGSWRERGIGQLRLNCKLGGGQPRLVMRADATHRLLLNASLFPGFTIKAADRQVQFATVDDGKFVSWSMRVSNAQNSTATVSAVQGAVDKLKGGAAEDSVV